MREWTCKVWDYRVGSAIHVKHMLNTLEKHTLHSLHWVWRVGVLTILCWGKKGSWTWTCLLPLHVLYYLLPWHIALPYLKHSISITCSSWFPLRASILCLWKWKYTYFFFFFSCLDSPSPPNVLSFTMACLMPDEVIARQIGAILCWGCLYACLDRSWPNPLHSSLEDTSARQRLLDAKVGLN